MKILHTEASNGWGGQEIRILREAIGMRERGHELFFVVTVGGQLAQKAREKNFTVFEVPLEKKLNIKALTKLIQIIRKNKIDIVNTHSSTDAWLAGIAARLTGCKIVRTRHLSAHINKGLNSVALYNWLSDFTATTCKEVAVRIRRQAYLPESRCQSIPTGMKISDLQLDMDAALQLRKEWKVGPKDCLIGTTCILRSWKGLPEFIEAAKELESHSHLKWVIVGSGPMEEICKNKALSLGLEDKIIFTGFLKNPFPAIAAMDVFLLLSRANEGVSQASLQAAYLQKPLITTPVGGLGEVCVEGVTGFQVPINSPKDVAEKVKILSQDESIRRTFGTAAQKLVKESFTFKQTLDGMESAYRSLFAS